MYGSILRHLGLSAFVSSALVAAIAAPALTSSPAAEPVVQVHPADRCPTLISSVKIRLVFDGKPFH
ncbi:hypothetical protein [Streptomyces sp. NRRL S-646]|uniref:hypothetical protein n=1 Tax=Streptomyces sp. NRRL S-646 TaxID=1463917 RepID=UPI0004C6582E|nr:hypothetical protein [Streptomyces sp. NRRL S-646]